MGMFLSGHVSCKPAIIGVSTGWEAVWSNSVVTRSMRAVCERAMVHLEWSRVMAILSANLASPRSEIFQVLFSWTLKLLFASAVEVTEVMLSTCTAKMTVP